MGSWADTWGMAALHTRVHPPCCARTTPALPTPQVGNYGGAWYRQQKEFSEFPGAILVRGLGRG